jgi:translation initiation factor 3 subunit F
VTQGYVEIKDCFSVPISDETEEKLEVDIEFHLNMFELHHKIHPTDVIIGWFSTGSEILPDDMIIHDFYSKNILNHPLFLLVDTVKNLEVKGFIDRPIVMGTDYFGIQFQRIPLEYNRLNCKKKSRIKNK